MMMAERGERSAPPPPPLQPPQPLGENTVNYYESMDQWWDVTEYIYW